MGDLTEHFSRIEFQCGDGCGLNTVDLRLVQQLESARCLLGRPIRVTSGVRCAAHNSRISGSRESAHLLGLAADLACPTPYDRYDLLMALLTLSFRRVGIGKDFIHVDIDRTKPSDLCWLY